MLFHPFQTLSYKFALRYLLSSPRAADLERFRGRRKCVVCLAADYTNLGDVAITYAQTALLRQRLEGYEIVDFPISRTLSDLKALKNLCTPDDIITIVGGGNMGDRYFDIELLRQMIVRHFPKNRVISFPQTMDYSRTKGAAWLRRKSIATYSSHARLCLCARERTSLRLMQQAYPHVRTLLLPDVVMTLDERQPITARRGVTFSLRSDGERNEAAQVAARLREHLLSQGELVFDYDTHLHSSRRLTIAEREEELRNIWAQYRRSECVVTDRLHGMIFAFITETPAIVFPNSNFKIARSYDWIKECGYISFAEGMDFETALALLRQPRAERRFEQVHQALVRSFNALFQEPYG